MIFMYLFVSYMCIEWFILLHDLYSIARPLFQFIVATPTTTCAAALQHEGSHVTNFDSVQNGTGKKKALGVNPKTMMERLGTFWDPDDQRETIVLEEMVSLFVDDEPSLDEVKQAFSVFDKNNDGYIDAKELQNVLYGMGFLHISERDCGTMIDGYDADKDGKISFRDFLKVVEDSFL
ncbi:putative EF-hand domain-containing protein [Helianthus annuus]|nr:putative EF-hand domain pair protein CML [Helianthus annuus]KAJ0709069.1 putative EF-hand domain-containing protein [Helianthus annuus]KAJ0712944.1 putative EF-hand domain-containing protein [Helianthus annuus]